jgi:dTDP-4-amino-4,6-dideoxygalactose transaminase
MPAAGAALAHVMLGRLEEFTARRTAAGGWWQHALADVPGLQFVRPRSDASAAFLRLPLLEADSSAKERTILALRQAGIGATGSYPLSLADVPGLQPHLAAPVRALGGRAVASRIVTLPTHPMVTERDVRRGAAAIVRSRSAGLFAVGQKRASSLE